MEMKCKEYLDLIKEGLDNVDDSYFRLQTTYDENGIVRERVFCYELYHQIRCLQQSNVCTTQLTLNGEIDKRGHVDFDRSDRKNPDFNFHVPGTMGHNTFVIEVKGTIHESNVEGCKKDFNTLVRFIDKYQYKYGIFIAYNSSLKNLEYVLEEMLEREFNDKDIDIQRNIIILCKEGYGIRSEITTLYDLLY